MKRMLCAMVIAAVVAVMASDLSPQAVHASAQPATRYEVASIVVRAMARTDLSKASEQDKNVLVMLCVEFWEELDALGVKADEYLVNMGAKHPSGSVTSSDVLPGTSWTYDTASQLIARGVSPSVLTDGRWGPTTRYEMASIVEKMVIRTDASKISEIDRWRLTRLIMEFWEELETLGMRPKDALYRIGAKSAEHSNPFVDVPPDHWSHDAIAQLAARGIISGYPDGSYKDFGGSTGQSIPMIAIPLESRPAAPTFAAPSGHAYSDSDLLTTGVYQGFGKHTLPLPLHLEGIYYLDGGMKNTETARYGTYPGNPIKQTLYDPFSTFGLDVATTSYSNARRFLRAGRVPPVDAVRVEEFINYFPAIEGERAAEQIETSPFRMAYEIAPCPWNERAKLLWLSLTAAELDYKEALDANLVFLVDVSGSMDSPERLPLVKSALKMLVERLRPTDRISLVTYAGYTTVALEATPGREKEKILAAIEALGAGGSTAGAAGLKLAYEQAHKGLIRGGVNRILLCTDGDFNVGVSNTAELKKFVERERASGVTLSILGFGTDNYNDEMMTAISSAGNGNYSYVDNMMEAKKVLDEEMVSTLVTVAKDAKVQMEFNPAVVSGYRLIGYEKRALKNEEFADDAVDAGDVGAGSRVVILYELYEPAPVGTGEEMPTSRYRVSAANEKSGEAAWLSIRWKQPDGKESTLAGMPLEKSRMVSRFEEAGTGLRFSAAVAAYAQKLRQNPELKDVDWKQIEAWANGARGDDPYRAEFLQLVQLAGTLLRAEGGKAE